MIDKEIAKEVLKRAKRSFGTAILVQLLYATKTTVNGYSFSGFERTGLKAKQKNIN
jgi:hypothetical protein